MLFLIVVVTQHNVISNCCCHSAFIYAFCIWPRFTPKISKSIYLNQNTWTTVLTEIYIKFLSGQRHMNLTRNYLNIIVFASVQFAIGYDNMDGVLALYIGAICRYDRGDGKVADPEDVHPRYLSNSGKSRSPRGTLIRHRLRSRRRGDTVDHPDYSDDDDEEILPSQREQLRTRRKSIKVYWSSHMKCFTRKGTFCVVVTYMRNDAM